VRDAGDGTVTDLSDGKFRRRKPAGQYHHGDLRQALLDTAGRLVERDGLPALTLRAIARELGVTHMAAYHHYRDRRDLLAALATRGYERLGEALAERRAGSSDSRAALKEVGVGYVTFAVTNPGYFRVMFSAELEEVRDQEPLKGATAAAFAVFADALRAAAAPEADVDMAATAAWALVHGLSVLLLDRQLPGQAADAAGAERLARAMLREIRIAGGGRS
jgi:AcrR family transcriptional regulator